MTNPKQPSATVKVGQIWQDCDKRMGERKMRVTEVNSTHAYMEHTWVPRVKTRILLRRMRPTSTGWRLIQDVAD